MKTILIAEDEKSLRTILKNELDNASYNILEAKDGVEALAILKSQTVDLLILDVTMPGISGTKVAEMVQKSEDINPKPEIIILSNRDDFSAVADTLAAGAFTYWVKTDTPIEKIVEEVNKKLKV